MLKPIHKAMVEPTRASRLAILGNEESLRRLLSLARCRAAVGRSFRGTRESGPDARVRHPFAKSFVP